MILLIRDLTTNEATRIECADVFDAMAQADIAHYEMTEDLDSYRLSFQRHPERNAIVARDEFHCEYVISAGDEGAAA